MLIRAWASQKKLDFFLRVKLAQFVRCEIFNQFSKIFVREFHRISFCKKFFWKTENYWQYVIFHITCFKISFFDTKLSAEFKIYVWGLKKSQTCPSIVTFFKKVFIFYVEIRLFKVFCIFMVLVVFIYSLKTFFK